MPSHRNLGAYVFAVDLPMRSSVTLRRANPFKQPVLSRDDNHEVSRTQSRQYGDTEVSCANVVVNDVIIVRLVPFHNVILSLQRPVRHRRTTEIKTKVQSAKEEQQRTFVGSLTDIGKQLEAIEDVDQVQNNAHRMLTAALVTFKCSCPSNVAEKRTGVRRVGKKRSKHDRVLMMP